MTPHPQSTRRPQTHPNEDTNDARAYLPLFTRQRDSIPTHNHLFALHHKKRPEVLAEQQYRSQSFSFSTKTGFGKAKRQRSGHLISVVSSQPCFFLARLWLSLLLTQEKKTTFLEYFTLRLRSLPRRRERNHPPDWTTKRLHLGHNLALFFLS